MIRNAIFSISAEGLIVDELFFILNFSRFELRRAYDFHLRLIRDDPYWISRKNCVKPIELPSINRVSLV